MPEAVEWFDRHAVSWDRSYERNDQLGHWLRERAAALGRLVGNGRGDLLDAGMGSGRVLSQLVDQGWTAWGVDGSPRMVELARARLLEAAERLSVARVEQLPFPDARFDAVVSIGVLQFVEDLEPVTCELARVLRPGASLILSVGNSRSPYLLWRHVIPRRRAAARSPGRSQLVSMIRRAGLELDEIVHLDLTLLPAPFDRLFPRSAVALSRLATKLGPLRALAAMHLLVVASKPARPASPGRPEARAPAPTTPSPSASSQP